MGERQARPATAPSRRGRAVRNRSKRPEFDRPRLNAGAGMTAEPGGVSARPRSWSIPPDIWQALNFEGASTLPCKGFQKQAPLPSKFGRPPRTLAGAPGRPSSAGTPPEPNEWRSQQLNSPLSRKRPWILSADFRWSASCYTSQGKFRLRRRSLVRLR